MVRDPHTLKKAKKLLSIKAHQPHKISIASERDVANLLTNIDAGAALSRDAGAYHSIFYPLDAGGSLEIEFHLPVGPKKRRRRRKRV